MTNQNSDTYWLRIFPEEIWINILDDIRDDDLENCSNASLFFRRLLFPRRTTFLFPKVFQCLAPRYELDKHPIFYDDVNYDESVKLDEQVAKVAANEVWRFPGGYRLVCSTWNKTVETFYKYNQTHLKSGKYKLRFGRCWGYFDPVRDEEEFMKKFGDNELDLPQKNPFFQRSYYSRFESGWMDNDFANSMQFVSLFGKHIWYARLIIVKSRRTRWRTFYMFLRTILIKFPNLRALRIEYRAEYIDDNRTDKPPIIDIPRLTECISQNPLPVFEKLEYFQLKMNFTISEPIFNEILRNSQNVSQLHLIFDDIAHYIPCYDIFSGDLKNLTESSMPINCERDIEQLKFYGNKWKLKKFRCYHTFKRPNPNLTELLEMIENNSSGTLIELNFGILEGFYHAKKQCLEVTANYRLNLPKLRIFTFKIINFISLDFLLPAVNSLEIIKLERYNGHDDLDIPYDVYNDIGKRQVIHFVGYEEKMGESNIWTLFNKLKKFS